jgi:hypothetical protein
MSKDKPTTGELNIKLDGYILESATWRKNQDENTAEIKTSLKEILEHARYTNGRVTKLEEWSSQTISLIEELVKSKKEVENIKSDMQAKWTAIKWAGAVVVTIGGLALTLYTKEVSRETAQKVVSNLETKYNLTQ